MFGTSQSIAAPTTQTQNNMWMTNGNGKYNYFILFCWFFLFIISVYYQLNFYLIIIYHNHFLCYFIEMFLFFDL